MNRGSYPFPIPAIIQRNRDGNIVSFQRLKFINLRDLRPLNLKQIAREEA